MPGECRPPDHQGLELRDSKIWTSCRESAWLPRTGRREEKGGLTVNRI